MLVMRKLLVSLSAAVLGAVMIAHAQSAPTAERGLVADLNSPQNETPRTWFVQLSSPPTIDGTSDSALDREAASFRNAARSAGIQFTERHRYRDLWNGVTVRATARDVSKLRALPDVSAVFPVLPIHVAQAEPEDPGSDMNLTTALAMTGADVAHSELGLTGRGVRVAVIDTGIDYDHPDLGGCFGPGCRVTKGYDFVGDAFNADDTSPTYNPVPTPDPLPDDCAGHGTHVAGIIGANGLIVGVAPEVTFHAYRVFGCEGATTSDIMLEAMERAMHDGADVLNMSIGAAYQWPQYPTAQGADRLVRHGITVVASIGNDGDTGLYAASAPGVGADVIGVASFDNTHANLNAFTVSPDNHKIGYQGATAAPPAPTTGTFPMARTGTTSTPDDACAALPAGSLAGQVVLIRRGTCSFQIKAANAQAAGAAGVVIYNNTTGRINATVAGAVTITIPVVTITAADGALIDSRIAAGPTTMTWTLLVVSEPQPTGGLISSFSSYGPPPDLSFKPDVGAPGGEIRSTLPLEQGGYGVLSGTSMSSPNVAGSAALILQAHPHLSPADVRDRLRNTARPADWWGFPGAGYIDDVQRQGAGLIRVDDAATADAVITPSSLPLGEIESGSVFRLLRISATERDHGWSWSHHGHHGDDDAVTYTLGHQPALATGAPTFAPEFWDAYASVQFLTPTVTVGGRHHDGLVVLKITPPAVPDAKLFGGYITLTPDDGGPVLRVPYTGYNGDYQEIQALAPTPYGFPWLAKLIGTSLYNQPSGASYTMAGDDVPFFLLHFDHPVRELSMEVVDVTTGRSFHYAFDEDYIGRNSSATGFFALSWDGTTFRRSGGPTHAVPNGTYRIELSALKALGNPRNPAHTEHWTSPNITIARP
jgi:subtilisin family serine protease